MLPTRSLQVESPFEPQRIYWALAPHVRQGPPVGVEAEKPYAGSVSLEGFELTQATGQHAYFAVAAGRVRAVAGGSLVTVTIRMGTFQRVFMSLWLSLVGAFMLLTLSVGIFHAANRDWGGVVVFGGLTLFLVMFPTLAMSTTRQRFRGIADPLEKWLRDILGAPASPPYR